MVTYITIDFLVRTIDFSSRLIIATLVLPGDPDSPRDTLAGKNLITFQNQFPVCKILSDFYRQKCRAAAEILGVWEGHKLP